MKIYKKKIYLSNQRDIKGA